MTSTFADDRSQLANIAVDTFVAASLACMEHADPGSPSDRRCERLFAQAQQLEDMYVNQLWQSLSRAAS